MHRQLEAERVTALCRAMGLTLVALSLSACAPHYLVHSNFVAATHEEPLPEVTTTATYVEVLPYLHRIAVRAPDSCENRTAATARGQAASTGRIVQTNCGVEMAEIERAFSAAGYSVASWDAVRNLVAQEQMTPLAAARTLGAEVLFQINSLERSTMDPGRSGLWERQFHRSSRSGKDRGPARVPRGRGQELERIVVPAERELDPEPRLSATVNASAVLTESGDTIWYYEWTRVEPRSEERRFEVLVCCEDGRCLPVEARSEPAYAGIAAVLGARFRALGGDGGDGRMAGSRETVKLEARPASRQAVVYHRLVREVMRNLVSHFAAEAHARAR